MSRSYAWMRFWSDFPWDEELLERVEAIRQRRSESHSARFGSWTLTLGHMSAEIDNWLVSEEPCEMELSEFERLLRRRLRWRHENRERRLQAQLTRAAGTNES